MNKKVLLSIIAVCFILAGCTNKEITQPIRQTSPDATITEGTTPSETTAAASPTMANSSTSEEKLKSILLKYTSDQIVFIQSFTTGDNQNAAFAMAGSDVWFITDSDALKLKSNIMYLSDNPSYAPCLWTVEGTIIFKCEEVPGGSSTISHAWYVKDGKPIELPNTGMGLSYLGNGEFTTIGEDFDLNFTDGIGAGHTYKPYYLYWTTDGLKEYGGLKITQQQLLKVKGAQAVIDAITKSDNTIDEIYYRDNNIININYHSGDRQNGDFNNVTLAYKNNTVTPILAYTDSISSKAESFNNKNLNNYSYGGIYQAAFFLKIATYPEKVPMN
ncbi:hypothetical protein QA584_10205 [Anaerocolumna sp. AGMB13025]|uniref:hypothetical protein n=1 Tax=Anaerocolumna sp. AGMB13025 TaxID=3039116 RepID=UPI00241F7DF0|nr:hypothetical protein [Anaerocolumna sp. AGMB13025]WFR59435.1 hypothetical protein QA584_10205 [Anaerocolumna sp. AGMB13025]